MSVAFPSFLVCEKCIRHVIEFFVRIIINVISRMDILCVLSRFSHARLFVTLWTSLPGSSVHGILQARILEWVAMASSRGFPRPRDPTSISYNSCIGR